LVERRRCDRDRRAYYAHLTPEGTAFVARIFPEHAAAIEEAFSVLSADERATATALLRKVGRHAAGTE
jgi:MarR family 2-MHQ and catechol resistance regulon transcriptional repressor